MVQNLGPLTPEMPGLNTNTQVGEILEYLCRLEEKLTIAIIDPMQNKDINEYMKQVDETRRQALLLADVELNPSSNDAKLLTNRLTEIKYRIQMINKIINTMNQLLISALGEPNNHENVNMFMRELNRAKLYEYEMIQAKSFWKKLGMSYFKLKRNGLKEITKEELLFGNGEDFFGVKTIENLQSMLYGAMLDLDLSLPIDNYKMIVTQAREQFLDKLLQIKGKGWLSEIKDLMIQKNEKIENQKIEIKNKIAEIENRTEKTYSDTEMTTINKYLNAMRNYLNEVEEEVQFLTKIIFCTSLVCEK